MFILKAGILALSAGLIATGALAGETVNAHPDESARTDNAAVGDGNRVICRRENVTGSRLGMTRRCMTAAQWESERQNNRGDLERAQSVRPANGQ